MRLAGRPTADCGLIETQLGGAANDGRPYFDRDNNNFSPRIAAAWAPSFEGGILGTLFGDGKMSIRGGYSLVYDRMGMALVNCFDQEGAFGLSTGITNQLGGCDIGATGGAEPCVRWSGPSDTSGAENNVLSNGDPQLAPSPGASFPAVPPSDLFTVSNGLDDTIRNPRAHTFDFSISRELPGGMTVEVGYVGRRGRGLPLLRDFATAADVCDPKSGVCGFAAARELVRLSDAGQPLETLGPIPYWENMFPDWGPSGPNGGCLRFGQLGTTRLWVLRHSGHVRLHDRLPRHGRHGFRLRYLDRLAGRGLPFGSGQRMGIQEGLQVPANTRSSRRSGWP